MRAHKIKIKKLVNNTQNLTPRSTVNSIVISLSERDQDKLSERGE